MFDYGNANEAQREAIDSTNGLVLITAGPGTGKTFTLVKRAVYLIQECGVKPEQIMMATFTEKAAKELITRITNELAKRDISVNVNEMYIGTFHSLCLRIIKEHLELNLKEKGNVVGSTRSTKNILFLGIIINSKTLTALIHFSQQEELGNALMRFVIMQIIYQKKWLILKHCNLILTLT